MEIFKWNRHQIFCSLWDKMNFRGRDFDNTCGMFIRTIICLSIWFCCTFKTIRQRYSCKNIPHPFYLQLKCTFNVIRALHCGLSVLISQSIHLSVHPSVCLWSMTMMQIQYQYTATLHLYIIKLFWQFTTCTITNHTTFYLVYCIAENSVQYDNY